MAMSASYRAALGLAQEIESLEGMKDEVASCKDKLVYGEVSHYRSHGLRVRMPRTTALKLLVAEIARKQLALDEIRKNLKL